MELFRYFLPFLDPSSLTSPLTRLELEELHSVLSTLRRIFELQVERNRPIENRTVNQEKLESFTKALKYTEDLLNKLISQHPGDSSDDVNRLICRIKKVPRSDELLAEILARANAQNILGPFCDKLDKKAG